ncbi:MAG: hypothetical protein H0W50_11965 [Parachlamydiaceae bacterium]|nr:hypothetical protein [Parachlamydiaceae bacterium]
MTIIVAARASPISETHISEIYEKLKLHHPLVTVRSLLIKKKSDKNSAKMSAQETETIPAHDVDAALLERRCNAVIYPVNDVTEPLERGLTIAAVTEQKLAIVTHKSAHAMIKLFSCIDMRNKNK